MFGSKDLLFTSEKYNVARSLRFRSSASAYLSRTPASAGNRTTWTWSGWVKRGTIGGANNQNLFSCYISGTDYVTIQLRSVDDFDFQVASGGTNPRKISTAVLRDPSAWYHLVAVADTNNATAGDRMRLYVNGVRITNFSTSTDPSSGLNFAVNSTTTHNMGQFNSSNYLDGYLAEVNFIDGQALTPSSFGFYDNTGIWQPKGYIGTYGTNGFYLKFTDNSGATATTIGKDSSGNGNNWTPNNISVTSGVTYDSMYDSPVNASNGITGIGNYCVMNPLYVNSGGSGTYTNGNLTFSIPNNGGGIGSITITSGKWYWEAKSATNPIAFGIRQIGTTDRYSSSIFYDSGGSKYVNGTSSAYGASWTTSNTIGVALDCDGGTVTFYKDNVSQGSINLSLASITEAVAAIPSGGGAAHTGDINFGQRPFAYTPPSGYSALNTQNLTTPTITNGAQYMAAVLYTGTGSSQTITTSSSNSGNNPNGTTFQPDFVWAKGRSGATDHALYDAVRGVQLQLESNTTTDETTETTGLTAFTSSGFTTGALAQMNTNTATYVAWEWNAGGSTVTNTTGSISSQVRANTTAGFSVVTYTGTGANATVGHGLGAALGLLIVKRRTTAGADWQVWHSALLGSQIIFLNTTAAVSTDSTKWNSTIPSSTVFSLGTASGTNNSTSTFVAYCFAPVAGYSAFGSYTGNGSADGPFVYCGFRPRFLLIKRTDTAADWVIVDTSRNTYNLVTQELYPDLSNAESASTNFDILSNGFKLRGFAGYVGASGGTYIYAAFAENPFKYSRAR